jgi:succinate-acetate transporter protein
LGFVAFGIGMLLLGGTGNGWLHPSDRHTVGLVLAAFVFPLELVCTIFAFLSRDTFGATGLGMFSTSWLTLGLADLTSSQDTVSRAVGLFEFGFATAVVLLAFAALVGKPLIGVIMLLAASRAALAGVHEWGGPHGVVTVAGWLGIAIFALAMYGGLAFLLEDVHKDAVLPVFRLGLSKEAVEGDDEAGVRQTL